MPRILIVEDEPSLRELLVNNLRAENWDVHGEADGLPALRWHMEHHADLIILDLMLPDMDGFQVLRALRDQGDDVPVLMLTARGEESTRVQGFDLGTDDYLVKPFSILELLGRLRAILRRTRKISTKRARVLRSGPFHLDLTEMSVHRAGRRLDVGTRGFRILEVLLRRPGQTLGRTEILNLAWEADCRPGPRTVDVHIGLLRRKLGSEECITTVEGIGYRWTSPVESDEG
jgi:DNA-binding response OmpR family regulator